MGHTLKQLGQFGKDSKVDVREVLHPKAFDDSTELLEEKKKYPQTDKHDTECNIGFTLHCFIN
jgi:hypothetical protein